MSNLAKLEAKLQKAKNEVIELEAAIRKAKNVKSPRILDPKVKARVIKLLTSGHTSTEAADIVGCNVQQAAAVAAWISRQGRSYIKKS